MGGATAYHTRRDIAGIHADNQAEADQDQGNNDKQQETDRNAPDDLLWPEGVSNHHPQINPQKGNGINQPDEPGNNEA